jgi:hypothetical protein
MTQLCLAALIFVSHDFLRNKYLRSQTQARCAIGAGSGQKVNLASITANKAMTATAPTT